MLWVGLQCVIVVSPEHTHLLFKPTGLPHSFPLGQSISVLNVVRWVFFFILNLNRTFCRQTVETQIRRNFLKSLLSAYVTQKDVSLIWVNHNNVQCINNSRTTAIEWAAVKATAGREAEIKDVFGPRWIWLKFKYTPQNN